MNAEDPEATVIILEDDQKKDYTIIAQNESEAVEENESFGSFSIVKQKNISSSSDVQVMECNQSPQVISSFSQEDFSNMIEPPSQMNASSFTKSEVENSALMGNLIKRSDVNATNNSRFNIISEYILPPGISIRGNNFHFVRFLQKLV